MKADFVSFKRAADRCLMGLGIQLLLGLALLIYGFRASDQAAVTASFFILLGVPVWLCLAIVFDQHRRERVEAMEAESLAASSSVSSSVFEEGASDLRLAARRLKAMHRFFVPGVSLAIGAALLGIGWWRYGAADFNALPRLGHGWPIALGVGLAVVGFVFARYISGMAKQPVWANLRGGAAYAAGTSLFGVALVVAHFVDLAGPDTVLRWLNIAFPVALMFLGAEVFLHFVLGIYRPRKAGDIPRPAFDSRLLGFIAAPDRVAESISGAIDYQLGYNVTGSWFYQLISRFIGPLVALGLFLLWAMTSIVVVQPHQRGMILRFGRPVQRDVGPGLHFKAPWPIDRLALPAYTQQDGDGRPRTTYTATGVRTLDAGALPPGGPKDEPILWTTEHTSDEMFTIVQPAATQAGIRPGQAPDAEPAAGETDLALVAVEVPVHYAVRDVEAYELLAAPSQRDTLLRAAAQRAAMQYISTLTVDQVLDKSRSIMAAEIRSRIEQAFIDLNPKADGTPVVEVLFVGTAGAHPPKDVAPRFEQVIEAQQKFHSRLDEARAEASKTLISVVGDEELAWEIDGELAERDRLATALEGVAEGPDREDPARALAEQELKIRRLLERAGGSAASDVFAASADRWTTSLGAKAEARAYAGKVRLDAAARGIYRAEQYFNALRGLMAGTRVYITSDDVPLRMVVDVQDKSAGAAEMLGNIGDLGGQQ
jgi:membrane protease subunit HflK